MGLYMNSLKSVHALCNCFACKRYIKPCRTAFFLLFWFPGCEWLSVDVDDRLLPEVDPVDKLLVAVLLLDRLQALVEPVHGGLAGAKHGKARKLDNKKKCVTCRLN
jgi:hypothetical protein